MKTTWTERTELLIKSEGIERLNNAHILVVGLGGVGSYAAEFLARAGVGNLTVVDGDVIDLSNINRQLPALHSTIGLRKTDVMERRLYDINPDLKLSTISKFLSPEAMENLLENNRFDYIVDCIDSVSPKITLIHQARKRKMKIVSCMGAGGKLDPSKINVKDISKTNNCYLAKHIRKRLKRDHHITKGVKCVFSTELQSQDSLKLTDGLNYKKSFYGTISYIPAAFGLHAAGYVINQLIKPKL